MNSDLETKKTQIKVKKRPKIFSILWRLIIAIAIVVGAVFFAKDMMDNRDEPPKRQARERIFTISVIKPEIGNFSPSIKSFGEVVASKTLDIRSQVLGETLFISKNLITGGNVIKGETLIEIDKFNYEGSLSDAKAVLNDAQLQLIIAKQQSELEKINVEIALKHLEFSQTDFERAKKLNKSGSLTNKELENSEFTVLQREQTLAQRKSALIVQQTSIERQKNAILRAKWTLEKAQEALENTKITSPFNGVVISENAQLNKFVTNNEIVAKLYEKNSLEVRFTLSDAQYGYLNNAGLLGREITTIWDIKPTPLILNGEIVRAGAEVIASRGGVEIFASLKGEDIKGLKPGTFVQVNVAGLVFNDAIKLPETAIYENSYLYIFAKGRMKKIDIEILARDGENLIIKADIPLKARIITTRLAQASEGLRVKVEGEEPKFSRPPNADPANANPNNANPANTRRGQNGANRAGRNQ